MNPTSSNAVRLARRRAARAAHAMRRQHWLNGERLRTYALVALVCYGVFFAVYLYRTEWQHRPDFGPLALDFLPFWSASFLALHHHAIDAYNLAALTAVETEAISHSPGILPWLYPPTFLLIVYPLVLLPFQLAATVFLGGTLGLFVGVIRTIVPARQTVLLALAFPGAALVLVSGQNGLLSAALVGLGLVLLRRRPVLAGICFGLLCIKPHLAVLLPLALLCSRSWRALGAMALTAAILLVVSVLLFGTGTLQAFLHNVGFISGLVESGRAALARIPTVFAMTTLAHAPRTWAYAAQGASALIAAATVCHAWGRDCPYALRAAVLVCASLLVSPYLFDYDLAWLGVLIAWYARYGLAHGWKRYEREWLVGLWFAPIAGVFVVAQVKFQFMPVVTAATLWMLTRRIAQARQEPVVLQDDNGEACMAWAAQRAVHR
jgi:Glycosyltransferase family 87